MKKQTKGHIGANIVPSYHSHYIVHMYYWLRNLHYISFIFVQFRQFTKLRGHALWAWGRWAWGPQRVD